MMDDAPSDAVFHPARISETLPAHAGFAKLYLGGLAPAIADYRAGQFVYVRAGGYAARPYSIANAPGSGYIELHIRNGGDGLSRYLCEDARPGGTLEVAGPYGTCTYGGAENDTTPLLTIVGGTGFAPAKAIVEAAFADAPSRTISLFYGARSFADVYDFDWLEALARSHRHFSYALALEDTSDDYTGTALKGRVDDLLTPDRLPGRYTRVYLAGPAPMVSSVRQCLEAAGVDMNAVFWDTELFGDLS
jgi:NAD(P)H-flavin reductase